MTKKLSKKKTLQKTYEFFEIFGYQNGAKKLQN